MSDKLFRTPLSFDKSTYRVRDRHGESVASVFKHHEEPDEILEQRGQAIAEALNEIARLRAENEILRRNIDNKWIPIKNEDDLPPVGLECWVTYKDFYGDRHLGKGARGPENMWWVHKGVGHHFSKVLAYIPCVEPEIYED